MKQDLTTLFDYLRDNNDSGHRAYRVAELLAPMTGTAAPAVNATFIGQKFIDTATNKEYTSVAVGSATPADDWVSVIQEGDGSPTANANFAGQIYVDVTNDVGYLAIQVGAGASDWKQITNA